VTSEQQLQGVLTSKQQLQGALTSEKQLWDGLDPYLEFEPAAL
jgi:hypothetical protein